MDLFIFFMFGILSPSIGLICAAIFDLFRKAKKIGIIRQSLAVLSITASVFFIYAIATYGLTEFKTWWAIYNYSSFSTVFLLYTFYKYIQKTINRIPFHKLEKYW